MWHTLGANPPANDMLRQLADEYGAATGAHVQLEAVGGGPELIDRLGDTPAADWPNIVVAPDSLTRNLYDSARFLVPDACAPEATSPAELLPAVRAHYEVDGRLVAVPFGVSTLVLWLDRVEYTRAGLDPDTALATFDDLLAAAAQVRARGASPHGLVVDDHCIDWAIDTFSAMRGDVISPPANGHDDSPVEPVYDTPANRDTLTKLQASAQAGDTVFIGNNESSVHDLMKIAEPADGATMALHTTASLGQIISLMEQGNFAGNELGVLPLPGPGDGALVGGNAMFLVDHEDPAVNGAAWDLVDWLSAPAQVARLDAVTGYLPPDEATAAEPVLVDAWAAHPELRVGYDQLRGAPGGPAAGGLLVGAAQLIDDAGYSACSQLLDEGRDPATVLADLQSVAAAAVAAYRPPP